MNKPIKTVSDYLDEDLFPNEPMDQGSENTRLMLKDMLSFLDMSDDDELSFKEANAQETKERCEASKDTENEKDSDDESGAGKCAVKPNEVEPTEPIIEKPIENEVEFKIGKGESIMLPESSAKAYQAIYPIWKAPYPKPIPFPEKLSDPIWRHVNDAEVDATCSLYMYQRSGDRKVEELCRRHGCPYLKEVEKVIFSKILHQPDSNSQDYFNIAQNYALFGPQSLDFTEVELGYVKPETTTSSFTNVNHDSDEYYRQFNPELPEHVIPEFTPKKNMPSTNQDHIENQYKVRVVNEGCPVSGLPASAQYEEISVFRGTVHQSYGGPQNRLLTNDLGAPTFRNMSAQSIQPSSVIDYNSQHFYSFYRNIQTHPHTFEQLNCETYMSKYDRFIYMQTLQQHYLQNQFVNTSAVPRQNYGSMIGHPQWNLPISMYQVPPPPLDSTPSTSSVTVQKRTIDENLINKQVILSTNTTTSVTVEQNISETKIARTTKSTTITSTTEIIPEEPGDQ